MGQSLSTKLIYGVKVYDADEEAWPYPFDRETYRTIWPAWVDLTELEDQEGEPDDFEEQCEDHLLKIYTSFREAKPAWNSDEFDGWYDRYAAAKKTAGLGSGTHELGFHRAGTTNYQDIYLGYKLFGCSGAASEFDLQQTADAYHTQRSNKDWANTIEAAVKALNFEFKDVDVPRMWLLAKYS